MRVTGIMQAGFLSRSLSAYKQKAVMFAAITDPYKPLPPYPIITFDSADVLKDTKRMSDRDIGGYSEANTDWVAPSDDATLGHDAGYLRFHGNIDPTLPKDRPDVHRSGYAGWRTLQQGFSLFGKGFYNLEAYKYLAMRIKSDGRKYFVNIQMDSRNRVDLHQHRLYAKNPGEWETVKIKLNEFVLTQHGTVIEPQHQLDKRTIKTVGVSLIDRIPGHFDLSIERIWACDKADEQNPEMIFKTQPDAPALTKHGEGIRWNLKKDGESELGEKGTVHKREKPIKWDLGKK